MYLVSIGAGNFEMLTEQNEWKPGLMICLGMQPACVYLELEKVSWF